MTAADERIEALLTRALEARLAGDAEPDLAALCRESPDLLASLERLLEQHDTIEALLTGPEPSPPEAAPLPSFPGFRTIERLGRGGGGEVYKLEDLTLGRIVAAKVLRRDSPLASTVSDFLREARSLALFEDPRFVRLLEFRPGDPPILLMEHVDGFALSRIGPSLEPAQRARLVAEVAEAVQRAHDLGIQHRDLKPDNILVDATLRPRILDFGLARGEPDRGHGLGTLAYMAPEQLDPAQPIDERSDIYALGVLLFELLCGERPFQADTEQGLLEAIHEGDVRLPAEIEPGVPEPLQSIALTAMAPDPRDRYGSARELAADIRRYLEGRPVLARPPGYRSALGRRMRPHLEQIGEWERLRLVYPHEGRRLREAYAKLDSRDGDWILGSRSLSFSQICLYLGAFLLACGGLLYFGAYRAGAMEGLASPLVPLGLPLLALTIAAFRIDRGEHKAVAVAFHLGAALLLPLLLLVLLRESSLLATVAPEGRGLFQDVTNRQIQASLALSLLWVGLLALRTRTVALASGFAAVLLVLHLAVLADLGLEEWVVEGQWDALGLRLLPLLGVAAALGGVFEARRRPFLAQPLYFLTAALVVASLELLALKGRALALVGVTLAPLQEASVGDPLLLDTVAAMAFNGIIFLAIGIILDRSGTTLMRTPGRLLEVIAPFAILEPIAYLVETGDYTQRADWLFLLAALGIAFVSRFRQRRAFYTAGLFNTGLAIFMITDHYQWLERVGWGVSVLVAGLLALLAGLILQRTEWRRGPGRA